MCDVIAREDRAYDEGYCACCTIDHAIGLVGEAYATAEDVVLEEDGSHLHGQPFGYAIEEDEDEV